MAEQLSPCHVTMIVLRGVDATRAEICHACPAKAYWSCATGAEAPSLKRTSRESSWPALLAPFIAKSAAAWQLVST